MKSKEAMAKIEPKIQFDELHRAVGNLYYAAVWHADRPVDEQALWTAVRDAAGFTPGKSPEEVPFEGIHAIYGIDRLRQLAGKARANRHSATDFTSEKVRAFLLLHGEELQDRIDAAVRQFLGEKLS
jgi:ERCC4-related helicase